MDVLELCIGRSATIREAMSQLDHTAKRILFVVDRSKFFGVLTDGDVRRFLLTCGKMESLVEEAANKNPIVAESREKAWEILNARDIDAVPVVNSNGVIIDVCFASEKGEKKLPKLNIPVAIMAGGKGTRLYPYTKILPKPLIPIGELPIIEHIMQKFQQYGCNTFHTIVNYKKQLIKAYFSESEQKYDTCWYDEDVPLGTGGGLSLLKGKINETFFLTNCDMLIQADYDDMLRFHRNNKNTVTMICAYKNVEIPYGVIEMGENGSILEMKEKPKFSFLTNTGMYIVEPEVLDDIEENVVIGFPDVIEKQRAKGLRVAVYPVSENDWLDMGQMSELESMRKRLYGE